MWDVGVGFGVWGVGCGVWSVECGVRWSKCMVYGARVLTSTKPTQGATPVPGPTINKELRVQNIEKALARS